MINLNGIKVKNRFLVSAGGLGFDALGYLWEKPLRRVGLIQPDVFGAVVTKTFTLLPQSGNFRWYKFWETFLPLSSKDFINSMGLGNCGYDVLIEKHLPKAQKRGINLIPSIKGSTLEEWGELSLRIREAKVVAIELDISCGNVPGGIIGPKEAENIFKVVKSNACQPIIAKLNWASDFQVIAQIAERIGINAIAITNAIPWSKIYPDKKCPLKYSGSVSGKEIKKHALEAVSNLKQITNLPIIGGGGIFNWQDCQDFFKARADAVSFGAIHFFYSWRPTKIVKRYGG